MSGSAQRRVYVQSPFFIPDSTIAEALKLAGLAGVDVRVMLSARPSGNRLPHSAGLTYIADIVGSGVRVFLYDKGYLHAKTLIVDGRACSIGSANIDIRSFSINYELNAILYSEPSPVAIVVTDRRTKERCARRPREAWSVGPRHSSTAKT